MSKNMGKESRNIGSPVYLPGALKMREKLPVIILRIVALLFTLACLLVCVFVLPACGTFLIKFYPAHAFWRYPMFIGLYAAAACCFFAMFHFWILLNSVDRDGTLAAKSLRAIRHSAIVFSALYALFAMPLIFLAADTDDAPGLILIGAFLDTIPVGIAAIAAILERHKG